MGPPVGTLHGQAILRTLFFPGWNELLALKRLAALIDPQNLGVIAIRATRDLSAAILQRTHADRGSVMLRR